MAKHKHNKHGKGNHDHGSDNFDKPKKRGKDLKHGKPNMAGKGNGAGEGFQSTPHEGPFETDGDRHAHRKGDWRGRNAIARSEAKPLAKTDRHLSVADLEKALLKEFPLSDGEPWDRGGLLVGEGALKVGKVAVTLDPTVSAIENAASIGANVLVTHHPLFLEPPTRFAPEASDALCSGAGVWAAVRNRVACMNFHTSLDVSKRAQTVLPQILGLIYYGRIIEPVSPGKGYGQLCKAEDDLTLAQLASRCTAHFGRMPKVWGDLNANVSCVASVLGSAGDIGKAALSLGADVLVCGEIKYHSALELSQAGLSIIELGHDLSEFPLVAVLARAVNDAGIPESSISIIDQTHNWEYPETIRL